MKPRSVTTLSTASIMILALAGCTEPEKTTPVTDGTQQKPGEELADSREEGFGAEAPLELSLDERRIKLTASKNCNLERVNSTLFAGTPIEVSKVPAIMKLTGWVANDSAASVPREAALRLIGAGSNRAWKVAVQTGGQRDDVVKLLGNDPGYAGAGYAVTVDVGQMPADTYRIYTVFGPADDMRVCDNGRAVVIK